MLFEFFLNLSFTIIEFAGGLWTNSIAILADSVHDLGVAPSSGAALAIGVLTGPATFEDLVDHADHVLGSIAEIPALLTRLNVN